MPKPKHGPYSVQSSFNGGASQVSFIYCCHYNQGSFLCVDIYIYIYIYICWVGGWVYIGWVGGYIYVGWVGIYMLGG